VSEFELVDGYPIAVGFTLVALGFNHGYLQWRGFI
jgi:hypothetical protein